MSSNSLMLNSYLSQDLEEKSDAEVYAINNNLRYKTIKNNFIVVTLLVTFCLILNIISMAFYEWYLLRIPIPGSNKYYLMWLNLLYIYDPQLQQYLSFQQYRYSDYNICFRKYQQNSANLEICYHDFKILMYIGFFCFIFILCSQCFLFYDIIRLNNLLKKIKNQQRSRSRIKGKIVYTIVITAQFLALILYYLSVVSINELQLNGKQFGASYWVSLACGGLLIGFALYYKWSKARYYRFLIMEKLVTQELSQESLGMVLEIQNNDL